jgi:hypothetical protein
VELAEKAHRQALEIEATNIAALNNLAWIAMMTPERASEAVGHAKKAAEAAPKMGQAGYAGVGLPREWAE